MKEKSVELLELQNHEEQIETAASGEDTVKARNTLPKKRFSRRQLQGLARRITGFKQKALEDEYGPRKTEPDSRSAGGGGRLLFKTFIAFVILPSVLALVYYLTLASDVYVAEMKLTVRAIAKTGAGSSSSSSGAVGSLMSKIGLGQAGSTAQDTRIVLDYLKSRASMEDVGGREVLAKYYDRRDIDWLSRLDSSWRAEEILEYWRKKITGSIDTVSNILTLRVKAFSPDEALTLAQKLAKSSEDLINRISKRSREDALRRAEDEVSRGMTELADARLKLLTFQQNSQSIDPVESAKQITALLSNLRLQEIQIESQLAVGESTGVSGRPGDRYLQSQLDVVKKQIVDFEDLLTGQQNKSVSMQLKDFELLKLRQEFAEQVYTLARASYEDARREVSKQQLYLVVVVPPFKPEYPLFPRAGFDTALVFAGCFIFWAIGALLVASVKDSMDG